MVIVYRLAEVTKDSILQSTPPDTLIRVCGNEDRGDRVTRIYETSVQLDSGHSGHLNVADQTRRCRQERRCEEIGRRGEGFDRVAKHRHELSHGFAKKLIILDNRYQCWFLHHGSGNFLAPPHAGPPSASLVHA